MTLPSTALLDDLARLIGYPDDDLQAALHRCLADLPAQSPEAAAQLAAFGDAIAGMSPGALQEEYTDAFDFNPACALDLGWHLFGDAHERGPFMAALRDDLARAGVPETADLPDHLAHVLALAGREDPERAALLVDLVSPAIQAVERALVARGSPYQHLLKAVTTVLAGIGAPRVPAGGAPHDS
jgi:nitrate reductase molybdenum cofactor assembly chaperone NarJ/NarW